LNKDKGRFLNV